MFRFCLIFTGWLAMICGSPVFGGDLGSQALQKAAGGNRFLVALFYKNGQESEKTGQLKAAAETAAKNLSAQVETVSLEASAPDQQELFEKYGLRFAPLPLVLVIAPNGAVTGSFQQAFTEAEVTRSLVGPGLQQCYKLLQERKLVLLCLHPAGSAGQAEARQGAAEFLADPRLKQFSAQVQVDPTAAEEASLLEQFGLATPVKAAQTILLAPPGRLIGQWEGPVTKETMLQSLAAASSCGSGGCADPSCAIPADGQEGQK